MVSGFEFEVRASMIQGSGSGAKGLVLRLGAWGFGTLQCLKPHESRG